MVNKKKKHDNQSKRYLQIAIIAVSVLLVMLIGLAIGFALKKSASGNPDLTQSTTPSTPSSPVQPDDVVDPQPSDDTQSSTAPQDPVSNMPTEDSPMLVDAGIYIVHMGNFSGRYVEDGSDAQIENFCAVIIENRSERTVQLLQFRIIGAEREHEFRLTTLPPGERAIVQDLNREAFVADKSIMRADVEMCVFFPEEPSLHEDVFAISGMENGIELRNRTDSDIPGPIYVYYKTRTAEGYAGGITYRLTIPGLAANGTYSTAVNHFWPGSSQVMFIDYAQ